MSTRRRYGAKTKAKKAAVAAEIVYNFGMKDAFGNNGEWAYDLRADAMQRKLPGDGDVTSLGDFVT